MPRGKSSAAAPQRAALADTVNVHTACISELQRLVQQLQAVQGQQQQPSAATDTAIYHRLRRRALR
jgi:hypothetical protein